MFDHIRNFFASLLNSAFVLWSFISGVNWSSREHLEMLVLDYEYGEFKMYDSSKTLVPYWLYLRWHVLRMCWLNAFKACCILGPESTMIPYFYR